MDKKNHKSLHNKLTHNIPSLLKLYNIALCDEQTEISCHNEIKNYLCVYHTKGSLKNNLHFGLLLTQSLRMASWDLEYSAWVIYTIFMVLFYLFSELDNLCS